MPVDHFGAFCESLTQSEDRWEGQPLKLEPWQRRFWKEALEDWRSVVLIVARKNGKTSMLAAFALYELVYGEGRPEILWRRRLTAKLDGCLTPPRGLFAATPACPSGCGYAITRG